MPINASTISSLGTCRGTWARVTANRFLTPVTQTRFETCACIPRSCSTRWKSKTSTAWTAARLSLATRTTLHRSQPPARPAGFRPVPLETMRIRGIWRFRHHSAGKIGFSHSKLPKPKQLIGVTIFCVSCFISALPPAHYGTAVCTRPAQI